MKLRVGDFVDLCHNLVEHALVEHLYSRTVHVDWDFVSLEFQQLLHYVATGRETILQKGFKLQHIVSVLCNYSTVQRRLLVSSLSVLSTLMMHWSVWRACARLRGHLMCDVRPVDSIDVPQIMSARSCKNLFGSTL